MITVASISLGDIHCQLSQTVRGSPAARRFWCIIKTKNRHSCVSWPYKRTQRKGFPNGYTPS